MFFFKLVPKNISTTDLHSTSSSIKHLQVLYTTQPTHLKVFKKYPRCTFFTSNRDMLGMLSLNFIRLRRYPDSVPYTSIRPPSPISFRHVILRIDIIKMCKMMMHAMYFFKYIYNKRCITYYVHVINTRNMY